MIFARNAHLVSFIREKIKDYRTRAGRCLRRIPRTAGVAVPLAVAFLSLLAGGCSGQQLVQIKDQPDFDRQVRQSKNPILVEFYKGGCPTCVALEPNLVKLAEEYQGRVTFARFELMTAYFAVKAPDLKKLYNVSYFPTVILFVEGQEGKRWVLDYNMDKYREVLDKLVGPNKEKTPQKNTSGF
jgi:thioredoxin 1